MKKRIRLYGDLGRKFGREFWLAVATPAEAIKALCHQVKGFRNYLREHVQSEFSVFVDRQSLDAEELYGPVGRTETIKIVPLISGASNGAKVVIGAVLVVVGAVVSYFGGAQIGVTLIKYGAALMISGIVGMLTEPPRAALPTTDGNRDPTDYIFGSPRVTTGQGYPVPVGYGKMRIGGAIISSGIAAEAYQSRGFGGMAPDDAGTQGGDGSAFPWSWAIAPEASNG